jgi:hypothetical protein
MRESAKHAAAFALQSEHIKQLHNTVTTGNAALLGHLSNSHILEPVTSARTQQTSMIRAAGATKKRNKSYRLRISLPSWFVNCIWELGVHEADGVWTTQIWPVNVRPRSAVVFEYVESGDVEAVRGLLRSGSLSMRDHTPFKGKNVSIFDVSVANESTWTDQSTYSLQVAADNGKLELCRFLLQESSLFHRDETINYARKKLLSLASYKRDRWRAVQMVKEVIELFATVSGTDADIDRENFEALGEFYGTFLVTPAGFPLITLPVASIPFAERFAIATKARGWHPDIFATTFRGEEWAMFVTHASESGKTALHWAAEHYGWSRIYANLVIELIGQGSDVHACWNGPPWDKSMCKVSPFLAFLQRTSHGFGWDAASLADAVLRWGWIIVGAGQSLQKFAAMENDLIQANREAYGRFLHGDIFLPVGLEVLGEDRLAMRVEKICDVCVWKAIPRHVPGAWPASATSPNPTIWIPELPDTIIWYPEDKDEREGFRWIYANAVNIKVDSYLVEPPGKSDLIKVGASRGHDKYHQKTEDDHDLSLITTINALRSKHRAQKYTRRRSASAPAVIHEPRVKHMAGFPDPWNGTIHQCALDMRWRVSDPGLFPRLRDCMQSRCREWTGLLNGERLSSWEADLLWNKSHNQVARRFAQRFLPQHLNIVETTSARATERAQLAMGPARPPARSW